MLLILSRRRGEAIQIADSVEIKVLEIRKGRAKLGLSSPTHLEKRTSVPLSSCDGKTDAQDAASATSPVQLQAGIFYGGDGRHVSCEFRDGLPKVHRKVRGHYVSRQGGPPKLVMEHVRGDHILPEPCASCGGQPSVVCPACDGEGTVVEPRLVRFQVPPGLNDGAVLCVEGHGKSAWQDGPRGDLYLVVRVQPCW